MNISSSLTMNALRYGVTDNVEVRTSFINYYTDEQKYNYDVYLHSHGDSNFVNYGVMFGQVVSPVFKPAVYTGVIVSKTVTNYFTPYISYIFPLNHPTRYGDESVREYLAIGAELTVALNRSRTVKLHLIPEMEYIHNDGIASIGDPEIGTITVGLSIDFNKIFAP